jgi:hypothetical protein
VDYGDGRKQTCGGDRTDKSRASNQEPRSESHVLDEELVESFPGSDAASVTQPDLSVNGKKMMDEDGEACIWRPISAPSPLGGCALQRWHDRGLRGRRCGQWLKPRVIAAVFVLGP